MAMHDDRLNFYRHLTDRILGNPALAPIHPLFAPPASGFDNIDRCLVAQQNAVNILTAIYLEAAFDGVVSAVDEVIGLDLHIPAAPQLYNPLARQVADKVRTLSWASLPPLPDDKVRDMVRYFDECDDSMRFENEYGNDGILRLSEKMEERSIGVYPPDVILACPHMLDCVSDPLLLAAAQGALGCVPTLLSVAVWRSYADRPEPQGPQAFHFDLDDFRFCKHFIYLTDTDTHSGPHTVVEGTHNADHIAAARARFPGGEATFDDWYLRKLRKTDVEIETYLAQPLTELTGAAGSRLLVNTKSLHKGKKPEARERLIVAIEFGTTPFLRNRPQPFAPETATAARPAAEAYALRYFLNGGA